MKLWNKLIFIDIHITSDIRNHSKIITKIYNPRDRVNIFKSQKKIIGEKNEILVPYWMKKMQFSNDI